MIAGSSCCMRIKRFEDCVLWRSWTTPNEELFCDYHQLLVKSLSSSKREESSINCDLVRFLDRFIALTSLTLVVGSIPGLGREEVFLNTFGPGKLLHLE